ncbi:MAG: NAD(+) synthase [Clostridia bacterium]|nr:NAD(+) synthase [Clostridia bacterium]
MKDGFIKVAAVTLKVRVADVEFNILKVNELIHELNEKRVRLAVFPELTITGYTCGDLFFQEALIERSMSALDALLKMTADTKVIAVVGLPFSYRGKLYNTAAVIYGGKLLGLIPKSYLPNYNEFYEKRYFTPAFSENSEIMFQSEKVAFGKNLLFACEEVPGFRFAVEICEDLWAPISPSVGHTLNGATIIVNLSASNEVVGKADYRRLLVSATSGRLNCGYIYADAGKGESTTDMVFAGHNLIAENGGILAESKLFSESYIISEIDVKKLENERRKNSSFEAKSSSEYKVISFHMEAEETELTRTFSKLPFLPAEKEERDLHCRDILAMQSNALTKRIEHISAKSLVIGLSGGLDSCLALLVSVMAMKLLGRNTQDILAVTMPCFGTSDRTRRNAEELATELGVTFRNIDIKDSVLSHFKDIGQKKDCYDVTYENAQARERTQVLMDLANQRGGIVIGTGDLSEMALGWSTYNGDHMSMYGVNCSVPKTLIRYMVEFYAEHETENEAVKAVLADILATPISPELLPGETISQKTEEIVGPYELHDFFLYYVVRFGFSAKKVLRIAKIAFEGVYEEETIRKWLKDFYRRFFNSQFKRSCVPDGPKVGSVSLSPRGDWRMPSDACYRIWMEELEDN